MKRFLFVVLIFAVLSGYALMAMGSNEASSSSTGNSTSANTANPQQNETSAKEKNSELTTAATNPTPEEAPENSTSANAANQQQEATNTEKNSELITAATNPTPEEALEYVKRAAVTAMTNWCAFDGKIHSYSDTSGDRCLYYMFVTSWGTWVQKGDNNYQVQNLQLRTYGKEDGPTGEYDWDSVAYKFTLDVNYDPSKKVYTISNVYGAYKEKGDTAYTNMKFCASDKLFSVPFSLVEKDR